MYPLPTFLNAVIMRVLVCLALSLVTGLSYGQRPARQALEATVLTRWDKHADYTTRFGNRTYAEGTQLAGLSYGIGLAYRFHPIKGLRTKIGLGYYQLRVDKVRQTTLWGIATARSTTYDDGQTNLLYSAQKYHYNALQFSAGLESAVQLKPSLSIVTGIDINYYYTFTQSYKLNKNTTYRPTQSYPLGMGVNAQFGIQKQLGAIYLQPQVVLPIYQRLKGDEVFGEEKSLRISKWFNGIGVSFSFGKYF